MKKEMERKVMQALKKLGYKEVWTTAKPDSVFYRVGDADDVTGYIVEIDCLCHASRRKGNGAGCFWTEWDYWSEWQWEAEWEKDNNIKFYADEH